MCKLCETEHYHMVGRLLMHVVYLNSVVWSMKWKIFTSPGSEAGGDVGMINGGDTRPASFLGGANSYSNEIIELLKIWGNPRFYILNLHKK